jgi:hypothetical protein
MTRKKSALRLAGIVVAGAMLAMPASGLAAQTVGLSFNPTSNCPASAQTYYGQKSTAPDPYVIPAAGVITAWTFRTAATGFPAFKLAVGTSITNRIVRTDAESQAVTLPANAVTTTPVRIPVVAGQRLGFYTDTAAPCYAVGSSGVDDSLFSNFQSIEPGTTATFTALGSWAFPLSARLEPDVDGDGYGDETQDSCTTAPGPGPCPPPAVAPTSDGTAPVLSPLSLSRSSFKAAAGTKVTFALSEASRVVLTVERQSPGRRVSGTCKPQTSKNKSEKRCHLWVKVGSFSLAGKAGPNTFTVPSRIGGKALTPGAYRLTASATDPSKNTSLPSRQRFTIVK